MQRILISGYLGFDNFGDEALLYVLIKDLLNSGFRREEITVISNNPDLTKNLHGVNSIPRLNPFSFFATLFFSRTIIFIGGLFQDKTSFRSFFYYFLQAFFAVFFGKEIVLYGAGIGPLQRKISKILFDFVAKYVYLITVRDQYSSNLTPWRGRIPVTCDPVWSIDVDFSFQDSIKEINWNMPIIGISMRNDKYLKGQYLIYIADKLSRVLVGMKDWQVILVPCMPAFDLPILYELRNQILKKVSASERIFLIENFHYFSVEQQAGILASCDVMVGMRYHALLVPLAQGKPVFGLIYDQKVKSLLDFAGQLGVSFRDSLEEPWSYFWQNLPHSSEKAREAREKAIELHKRNIELLQILRQR